MPDGVLAGGAADECDDIVGGEAGGFIEDEETIHGVSAGSYGRRLKATGFAGARQMCKGDAKSAAGWLPRLAPADCRIRRGERHNTRIEILLMLFRRHCRPGTQELVGWKAKELPFDTNATVAFFPVGEGERIWVS